MTGAAGLMLLLAAALSSDTVTSATTTTTFTVTTVATGTMQTHLSTNNVWAGEIDQMPGAQQWLDALHDPLIRLHVGDDGPVAMPEVH